MKFDDFDLSEERYTMLDILMDEKFAEDPFGFIFGRKTSDDVFDPAKDFLLDPMEDFFE